MNPHEELPEIDEIQRCVFAERRKVFTTRLSDGAAEREANSTVHFERGVELSFSGNPGSYGRADMCASDAGRKPFSICISLQHNSQDTTLMPPN